MYWDRVAKFYDFFEGLINKKVYEDTGKRVSEEIDEDDIVLEVACGTGVISKYIAPKCRHLTVTDFSQKMLDQANKKLSHFNIVTVEYADITKLTYKDNSFNKVIAGNVIHLLDNPQKVLNELFRVCKSEGKVIIPT